MSKARNLGNLVSTGEPLADGVIDTTDINGVTATATEINYLDGVTSNLQTQLDNITVTAGTLTKSFTSGETASIALSAALSPAPVVSVTKEVPQTGISSKGAWDVATDGANYDRHDTAYNVTLGFEGWDISTASYSQAFNASAQNATIQGVFFKPDGTRMYITGATSDVVLEYALSTAWDVSTATYVQSFSVASQETDPRGIFFKDDGTKMYIIGTVSDSVNEYTLSTAWDVSTAAYSQAFSVAAQETVPRGLSFKDDGTKMYVIGGSGDDVNEYNLSTAWDVSTASYLQVFSVSGQDTSPAGIFFRPDGTKMFVVGLTGVDINEYNLSTAWDVSTASFVQAFSVSAQNNSPAAVFFDTSGVKMFVVGQFTAEILEYSLSTSFALGSGSFASTDVGKTIVGNGGEAILTATDGSYSLVTAFTDNSTIAAGSWSMYALTFDATNGVELSGAIASYPSIETLSYLSDSYTTLGTNEIGFTWKDDGTSFYTIEKTGTPSIRQYNLSTAYDISTASLVHTFTSAQSGGLGATAIGFDPTGTILTHFTYGADMYQYTLSTAWDLSTASLTTTALDIASGSFRDFKFNPAGNKLFLMDISGIITQYSTANFSVSPISSDGVTLDVSMSDPQGFVFNSIGTAIYALSGNSTNPVLKQFNLTGPFNLSGASYSNLSRSTSDLGVTVTDASNIAISSDGLRVVIGDLTNNNLTNYSISSDGAIAQPTAQYSPAITNTGGQIDTQFWTDINSMTADQTANDGQVYYAVSTDGRTTWSVAKSTDGVRPIVRNNAGTWEYNTAVGASSYDLSVAAYDSVSLDTSFGSIYGYAFIFGDNGTKAYLLRQLSGGTIIEYTLSTAYDLSTATLTGNETALSNGESGLFITPDGLTLYVSSNDTDAIYSYTFGTAWDVTTLGSATQVISTSSVDTQPDHITFSSDGTKFYLLGKANSSVYEYSVSTAYDLTTATYNSVSLSVSSQATSPSGLQFNDLGTKLFVSDNTTDTIYEYSLSTGFDLSTATYSGTSFSVVSEDTNPKSVLFNGSGSKMFVFGKASNRVFQYTVSAQSYTTATTWTAATTNDEMSALQQALTDVSFNRMDKTQLDAIPDGSHFTLGNSLDLMIALYLGSNGTSPTSDGVSINYDAQALNQGAILGTDYDYDFPDSTTVRITSNAAQNLKIRVV